ncbi:hypothetical protein ACWCOW_40205 [Streptomyces sp. NPDC001939]
MQMLITARSDTDDSPITLAPHFTGRQPSTTPDALSLTSPATDTSPGDCEPVLADHLLFAFNCLGISAAHQNVLATSASRVIFHRDPSTRPCVAAEPTPPAALQSGR